VSCDNCLKDTVELDNVYPYFVVSGQSTFASDTPSVVFSLIGNGKQVALYEVSTYFNANMYLMWDPSLDSSGNPQAGCAASTTVTSNVVTSKPISTCSGSISVPIAQIEWGYCGDAINTLGPQPTLSTAIPTSPNQWALGCPNNGEGKNSGSNTITPVYSNGVGAASYPTWSVNSVYVNSN
jgi:hypothetical protein